MFNRANRDAMNRVSTTINYKIKSMFKKVNPRQNFPEMEKDVLKFWKENKIFEKSVDNRSDEKIYSFFDGPPFATGMPHYGHVVANLMKDVVPRYWTMRGYKVERKWGWDCHGLPIENLIEKELDIKNKQEIEEMGVDKFNEACCNSVLRYADEWKKFIPRMGRWVDMENDYRTMDWKYTESIWWVFSELYKKGLVYEGYKSMHICPRCETTLSNFEVTQGYKDITDLSATVKFKLKYPAGKTGRGVGALIYNDKNEVLLLRRNEDGRRKTWAMPGGKVDKGETFKEALEREIDEELGVEIKSAEPFIAKPDIFEGRLFETVCFKVKIKGEPAIMEKNKVDKLEWFSLDNLPEVDYPPSRDALEVYKKNKSIFHFDVDMSKQLSSVYVLAWTTTPWTLPGNVAVAVENSIKYLVVSIKDEDGFYVLAKDRIEDVLKDKEFEVLSEIDGRELIGLEYESLFNYYSKKEDLKNKENGWKIYAGDFVTTEEGTGIVHIAPAFGDDDMKLAEKYNLPFVQHVGMDGRFKEEVADFREKRDFTKGSSQETGANDDLGKEVKPKRNSRETDEKVVKWLEENNKLFSKENYKHSYPHCWRCDTPLLNYATSSWFVKVTEIKDKMVKNNKEINWTPEYIKEGRFGKWLEDARDWAVSRSRYWGAPLPIWRCEECKNIEVINSIDDLREKTDQKITKLILLRHGESENNVKDIKAGQLEGYPLTKKGIKQVEDAVEILKKEKIDVVISSPILRTKQTAKIVNNILKVDYIEDERIKEYDFGSWNGHSSDDLFCKENK
ncbi:class I tRNA ligase family protein, partial [Candidatus Parcubacteria bacterium]|nr:class I tRNA ligase family protein [Candidatus Parcubacteria bacterium]